MPAALQWHRPHKPATKVVHSRAHAGAVARKLRSTGRWQAVRAMYLADHPLCEDPLGQHRQDERLIVSTEVHHRVPVQDAPDRLCDMENLMAVCRECHYAIEKKRDL